MLCEKHSWIHARRFISASRSCGTPRSRITGIANIDHNKDVAIAWIGDGDRVREPRIPGFIST
jgi:hypothetical protein